MEPHALCLTVFLSKASFSQTVYKNQTRIDVKHDIKIDVYFNGQFFDSQIMGVGQLHYTGSRGIKVRMHRFTGYKLSRFIEKPWIFVPPGHQSDGSRRASFPVSASIPESLVDAGPNQRASSPLNKTIPEIRANTGANRRTSAPVNASFSGNLDAEADRNLRWTTIGSKLIEEADRVGRDRHGERPVTGEYLECLASLPAPSELKDVQNAGGARFGIIDVVLIWGKGQKDVAGSKYLTEPTRLRLESYSTDCNGGITIEDAQIENKRIPTPAANLNGVAPLTTFNRKVNNVSIVIPAPNSDNDTRSRPTTQPDGIPTAIPTPKSNTVPTTTPAPPPILTPKTRAEALATASTLDGRGDERPKPTNPKELHPTPRTRQRPSPTSTTRQTSASLTRRTTPKRSRDTSVSSETSNPSKRQRMPYHHVMTAKRTYAEEMEAIVEQAVEEAEMLSASASASASASLKEWKAGTETFGSSPSSMAPEGVSLVETPSTASKVVTLKVSPPRLAGSPLKGGVSRDDGGAASHTQGRGPHNTVVNRSFDAGFVPPALSEDCCVTFAESGVVRSVGAVRGGWFEEKGVLMGTRFIVG